MPREAHTFIRLVMMVVIIEALVVLGLLVVGVLSSGYALSTSLIAWSLAGGAIAAVVLSFAGRLRAGKMHSAEAPSDGKGEGVGTMRAIAHFAVGIVIAVMLALAVNIAARPFRGPIVGVWELGTPRYARDQRPINLGISVMIIVIALLGAWLAHRTHATLLKSVALTIGLLAGAILLALGIASQ